ncbi:MAG: hypothetical protein V4439_04440 [Patescibacteria group bacterium]
MKKIIIGIAICLIVLLLTNPSYSDMKEHIPYNEKDVIVNREHNWLLFSIYHCKILINNDNGYVIRNEYYYGVLKQFYLKDIFDVSDRNHEELERFN